MTPLSAVTRAPQGDLTATNNKGKKTLKMACIWRVKTQTKKNINQETTKWKSRKGY